MRRETVNTIRYVLEEWLPPWLRDSAFMRWLFRLYWGTFVDDLERFRAQITQLSAEEYRNIYERMPRIQDETDNSAALPRGDCRARHTGTRLRRRLRDRLPAELPAGGARRWPIAS